jgi:hypothetical protein
MVSLWSTIKSAAMSEPTKQILHGSLELHPVIYFYGPTGRHLNPMFLGMTTLIERKLINNDGLFFEKFTKVRGRPLAQPSHQG